MAGPRDGRTEGSRSNGGTKDEEVDGQMGAEGQKYREMDQW